MSARKLTAPAADLAATGLSADRVRGTRDYLPAEAEKHAYVESSFAQVAKRNRFREIRTPVLEKAQVFDRTLGDTSDIVTKEMFRFSDDAHEVVLRPENTAGVVRALVASGLTSQTDDRYYYCGPMFRQEEPQRGRYRQFHQFGVELIGLCTDFAALLLKRSLQAGTIPMRMSNALSWALARSNPFIFCRQPRSVLCLSPE
jgi:histidyl-tRNA synthetase